MSRHIVILGAGFGGLTVATELTKELPADFDITIIDKKQTFLMSLALPGILMDSRHPDQGRMSLHLLEQKGIKVIKDEITKIDPSNKQILCKTQKCSYDYLVIALGAEANALTIPGFAETGYNLYDVNSVLHLRDILKTFHSHKIVCAIFGLPFKCPPAPYECILLIEDILTKHNLRRKVEIDFYTPEPKPVAISDVSSQKILALLEDRDINYYPNKQPQEVLIKEKQLVFKDGEKINFDLLVGVPPHYVPKVIVDMGLTDKGWIEVDPKTFKTKYENVYAIGDIINIQINETFMLPKAGVFAEGEAKVLANNLLEEIKGSSGSIKYAGKGYCFMLTGHDEAVIIKGDFLHEPKPQIEFLGPDKVYLAEINTFEDEHLAYWFK